MINTMNTEGQDDGTPNRNLATPLRAFTTLTEMARMAVPAKFAYNIKGWLPFGTVVALVAAAGATKSMLVTALAIAFSKPPASHSILPFGHAVPSSWVPMDVVYCDFESKESVTAGRINEAGMGGLGDHVAFFPAAVDGVKGMTEAWFDMLLTAINHPQVGMMILDGLQFGFPPNSPSHPDRPFNPNSSGDVQAILDVLASLASSCGVVIIIVHHLRKAPAGYKGAPTNSDVKGSGNLVDSARVLMMVEQVPNSEYHCVHITKSNYAMPEPDKAYYTKTDGMVHFQQTDPTQALGARQFTLRAKCKQHIVERLRVELQRGKDGMKFAEFTTGNAPVASAVTMRAAMDELRHANVVTLVNTIYKLVPEQQPRNVARRTDVGAGGAGAAARTQQASESQTLRAAAAMQEVLMEQSMKRNLLLFMMHEHQHEDAVRALDAMVEAGVVVVQDNDMIVIRDGGSVDIAAAEGLKALVVENEGFKAVLLKRLGRVQFSNADIDECFSFAVAAGVLLHDASSDNVTYSGL